MYMYDIIIFQYSASAVTVSSLRNVSILTMFVSLRSCLHARLLHIIAVIIIIIIRRVKSSLFYTLDYIAHGEETKNTKAQTEYI